METFRIVFPTYPRSFTPVPIGQTARFVLDQAVSIVRINGTLRDFRSPSQTQLNAAGTEGVDWFIGGREYDVPRTVALELVSAGFTVTPDPIPYPSSSLFPALDLYPETP